MSLVKTTGELIFNLSTEPFKGQLSAEDGALFILSAKSQTFRFRTQRTYI
jgi:hypothetical protein